jgi:hypothetical protein
MKFGQASSYFDGNISDLQVTKGLARYRNSWWRRTLLRVGLWIAERGGHYKPTVGYLQQSGCTIERWYLENGEFHHFAVVFPGEAMERPVVYIDGGKQ